MFPVPSHLTTSDIGPTCIPSEQLVAAVRAKPTPAVLCFCLGWAKYSLQFDCWGRNARFQDFYVQYSFLSKLRSTSSYSARLGQIVILPTSVSSSHWQRQQKTFLVESEASFASLLWSMAVLWSVCNSPQTHWTHWQLPDCWTYFFFSEILSSPFPKLIPYFSVSAFPAYLLLGIYFFLHFPSAHTLSSHLACPNTRSLIPVYKLLCIVLYSWLFVLTAVFSTFSHVLLLPISISYLQLLHYCLLTLPVNSSGSGHEIQMNWHGSSDVTQDSHSEEVPAVLETIL